MHIQKSYCGFDAPIIIVGGGPIGATLALGLTQHQIQTIIIDKISLDDMLMAPVDGKALAISSGSQKFLDTLGTWSALKNDAAPMQQILTMNGNEGATLDFTLPDKNLSYGYIVEMYLLRRVLAQQIKESKYIQWISTIVESIDIESYVAKLTTKTQQTYKSMVIVAADGRHSQTRTLMGISVPQISYKQKALVFTFSHSNHHQNTAYEKFLSTGTFAILPMTENRSSIVWTVPETMGEKLLSLSNEQFDQEFLQFIPAIYKDVKRITSRWSYDLSYGLTKTFIKPRFVLVGDAAHVIHPLAGQGLNLGFRDVKTLIDLFVQNLGLGLDIGMQAYLKPYSLKRWPDQQALFWTTHLLNKFFSNSNPYLEYGRALGLSIANDLPTFKKLMIKYAMS